MPDRSYHRDHGRGPKLQLKEEFVSTWSREGTGRKPLKDCMVVTWAKEDIRVKESRRRRPKQSAHPAAGRGQKKTQRATALDKPASQPPAKRQTTQYPPRPLQVKDLVAVAFKESLYLGYVTKVNAWFPMMTFQAMYRGVLLILAVGGTAILQSSAAPEKRDLSVAGKAESFMERLEGCSGGYRMRNGVCYKAFNTRKNFHDASSTCVADGGTLAMPKDAGTNAFLLSLKNAVHRAGWFWFGLVDHHQEGRWEWIDGTPLGFRAWGPGEPNNAGGEDCAEYFPTAWNDAPCSRTDRKFICQKIPTGCPGGYIYHQPSRQCYKAFNEKRTYSGAVARCSADRGTLAMPRDTATNKFLIYLKNAVDINGLFRFGLTDNHREGGWKWANNIPLGPFKAWGPGEPNNYANEDCAEYNAGIVAAPYSSIKNMWNDFECSNANRKFICQVSPVTCPAGYRPFQQNCFKAFPQTKPDYTWAMKACQAEGGRLAMPKDAATNAFLVQLKNAVRNDAAFYIGLSDQNAEGQWRFADGTALGSYNNWNPGEPNNVRNEDCATLLPGYGGKWNDLSCSSNLRYICQVSPIRPGGTSGLRRVCEHQTLTISCPAGRQINIVSALYGRTSRGFCPSSQIRTTSCRSPNSQVWVRGSCQGRSSCSVRASNSVFGDPCYGTFKYLEVSYTCIACSGKREMPDPGEPDSWPEEPGIGEADPQEPEIGEPGSQEPEIGEPGSQEPEIGEPGSQEPEIGKPSSQEPEIEEPGSQEPEIGEHGPQEPEIGGANEVREEDMLEKALEMLENEVRAEEDNLEYGLEE
ncbi:PREDICTED: uncharacterized protein LOC109468216 [Branchiostoma belcheri]|uniref:Uncharacterized protein LOC109468216 n=1 Tax=Branchiostoma belcheri TaxID=7741 RepID=A0A6P4XZF7_BRABE|nr:PREDICTED: uncharacterized protein LOC109468216 [Branchiostoma belcheri]